MGQYGKIGGRRSRGGGVWQWMLIGFFPGLLCGGLVIFLLLLSGTIGNFGAEPTPVVVTEVVQIREIITTTPQEPVVVTATDAPTNTPGASSIELPTATATPEAENTEALSEQPSVTPQTQTSTTDAGTTDTGTTNASAQGVTSSGTTSQDQVPPQLASIASPLVPIPGGVFVMGTTNQEIVEAARQCVERDAGQCEASFGTDSTPTVRVELSPYQMEVNEVTFQQYIAFLNWLSSQGQRHSDACYGFLCIQTTNENPTNGVITFDSANYAVPQGLLNHPVYGVTWYGAKAYCEAIGRRLPTEAEWEYAARTDAGFIYPWGNNWTPENANTRVPIDQSPGTFPIDSYPANVNTFQLRHMAGNVEEWVEDWYNSQYYSQLSQQQQPVQDPVNTIAGTQKVLRGGSWNAMPFFARTVHRRSFFPVPDSPNDDYPRTVGFRCAADAGTSSANTGTGSSNTGTSNLSVPSDGSGANTSAQPTLGGTSPESQPTTPSGDRG